MLGLELIMGGLLELASAGGCSKQKMPNILSEPLVAMAKVDYTKGRDDLQSFDIDTVSPYGPSHRAKIGGLMSGEIRVESRVRFMQEKYPARGAGCLHIDSIDLIIHVNPTIYVAREYARNTCQHDAILEHERQHVKTDAAIARKYATTLKNTLQAHLRSGGYSYGPYPLETMNAAQERIQNQLQALIQRSNDVMTRERRAEQQKLDSLEEYNRVSAKCPNGLKLPETMGRTNKPRGSVSRRGTYNQ